MPELLAPPTDRLRTRREAAQFLQLSERTVWTLTKNRQLAAVRIGRSVRYDPAELARFIRDSQRGGE